MLYCKSFTYVDQGTGRQEERTEKTGTRDDQDQTGCR
jgi:hypothetical protein